MAFCQKRGAGKHTKNATNSRPTRPCLSLRQTQTGTSRSSFVLCSCSHENDRSPQNRLCGHVEFAIYKLDRP